MATKFDDFMQEIEAEAKAEGPAAVAELEAFTAHFRLGRQVLEARLAKGLTQRAVARLAGVDQSDVSKIERGAANPTIGTFSAVVSAVGFEIFIKQKKTERVTATSRERSRQVQQPRRTTRAAAVHRQ